MFIRPSIHNNVAVGMSSNKWHQTWFSDQYKKSLNVARTIYSMLSSVLTDNDYNYGLNGQTLSFALSVGGRTCLVVEVSTWTRVLHADFGNMSINARCLASSLMI